MELHGAKVLITGGTSGIGRKTLDRLVKENAKVIVVARDQNKLDQLREDGMIAGAYCCDLANPHAVVQLAEKLVTDHPDLQILINNAGVQNNIAFHEDASTPQTITDELNTNLLAPLLLIRVLMPTLAKQKKAAIVNITTGLALVPKTSSAVYCGTKGGLRIFTKALQNQLEGTSIRVIEVLPPVVDTPMTDGRGKNKISPDKVANEIVRAIRGNRNEIFVGKTKLLYWVSKVSPRVARSIMRGLG
ncbi:SDR family oxidoreductase [Paenibacillus periandrae]|uniref:SDR family oxidoreductase n=1 Tax=Paenibacillus periandrae TaxID=1761741 RepID=UPI001F09C226|nr:SDR family NAD(P)-dependent oxidoreductase [Paenibacillus periandrae]